MSQNAQVGLDQKLILELCKGIHAPTVYQCMCRNFMVKFQFPIVTK